MDLAMNYLHFFTGELPPEAIRPPPPKIDPSRAQLFGELFIMQVMTPRNDSVQVIWSNEVCCWTGESPGLELLFAWWNGCLNTILKSVKKCYSGKTLFLMICVSSGSAVPAPPLVHPSLSMPSITTMNMTPQSSHNSSTDCYPPISGPVREMPEVFQPMPRMSANGKLSHCTVFILLLNKHVGMDFETDVSYFRW